jgi:hypothetical protein
VIKRGIFFYLGLGPRADNYGYFDAYSLIAVKIAQLPNIKTNLNVLLFILRKATRCRPLGIRIVNGKGNLPFFAQSGLNGEFIDSGRICFFV